MESKIIKLHDDKREQKYEICWEGDEPTVWHSTGECAGILGVSVRTVERAVKKGDLPAMVTSGKHCRIKHEDLLSYKERGANIEPTNATIANE
jgi:excisionase family DNA binding protein